MSNKILRVTFEDDFTMDIDTNNTKYARTMATAKRMSYHPNSTLKIKHIRLRVKKSESSK